MAAITHEIDQKIVQDLLNPYRSKELENAALMCRSFDQKKGTR